MIKKIFIKNQTGTSLVELLVYFALLSLVLVIVVDILFRTSEFSLEANEKSETQSEGRFISSRLTFDIRRADSLVTPTNLGETTPNLELVYGGETHNYTLAGTNLEYQVTTTSGTQSLNMNSNHIKVNSISFQRLGSTSSNHTIKITFELESVIPRKGSTSTKTFEFVVGSR